MLAYPGTWVYIAGGVLTNPAWWFYNNWVPSFLNSKFHVSLFAVGLPLILIYLLTDVGSIVGGWVSSALIKSRAVQRSLLWWHGPGKSEMPHTDANRPVIANWWFPRRGAIYSLAGNFHSCGPVAMASFSPFVDLLAEIEDPRRAEGKLYRLPEVVLFAILAIVAGANSYRAIHSFIDVHLAQLRDAFGMKWRKAPAYTTIRGILRQLDPASVEAVFRRHAAILNDAAEIQGRRHVAIDG